MKGKNGVIKGVLCVLMLAVAIFLISCQGVMPYCTVTFMNGEETVSTQTVLNGGRVQLPQVELPDGYEASWLLPDGTAFDPSGAVIGNTVLTLSEKPIEYKVIYELGGGVAPEGNPDTVTVVSESFTLLPATRDGAAFEGWVDKDGNTVSTLDASSIDFEATERVVTLTARWRVTKFSVTYDPAGGSLPDNPDTYTVDDTAVTLKPSELRGYTFLGWFTSDGERVESFGGQVGELALTARWEITDFSIVYDVGKNADNTVNPQKFTFLDTVTVVAPTRYGYEFVGWLAEGENEPVEEYIIPADTVSDVHLTAVWEAHSAVLTVMLGSEQYARFETEFGAVFTLSDLAEQRNGYALTAFFDPVRGEPVTLPYEVDGYAVTVYLFYTPIEYTVTLDYGDGNLENYRVFNVESETFALPMPTREGFTFRGWSDGSVVYTNIPVGSYGNKELSAVWERNYYTLVFDTMGGSPIEPVQIEYGAKIVFSVTTRRDGMVFGGWYEDSEYEKPFVGGTMPAETVTLFARWFQNASYDVNYSSDPAGVPLSGSCLPGSRIMDGTSVTLSAPEYYDGRLFVEWVVNGVSYGKSQDISIQIDGKAVNAVARYKVVHGYEFDISSTDKISISTFSSSAYLDGYGITGKHQTLKSGALTVDGAFLRALGVGLKVFALTENGSVSFVYVNITDSAPRPTVKVDFDSAFPNVILSCDIPAGREFVYSVNGSAPKPFGGSVEISGIDRSRANTFTVSPVGGGESYSKTVAAINAKYAEFYNGSFIYGGRTYDLVINSEDELYAIIEYICYVLSVTDAQYDAGSGRNFASLTFIIGEDYAAEFNADKARAYARVFDGISIPYAPAYTTSAFGESSPKGKVTVYFGELNTKPTDQEKTVLEDKFGILEDSDRPADFNSFYIDKLVRTQLIRSLYELEALPYGVRPVFDGSAGSQRAKQVYDKAREILRTCVSDGMTDHEKAAAIYGYMALNVSYDYKLAGLTDEIGKYRGFTSYGALIDGIAVCDGYASAYRIMCLIEGIECVEILGTSNGVGHAWNKVRIDGIWYGVDSTWSRVSGTDWITLRYLLINEAQLIGGGHAENEIGGEYESYTTFVASSESDYYDMDGRVIRDVSDIKALVNSAAAEGVTVLELKNLSGKTVDQLFRGFQTSDFNVENLSYTAVNGTDTVYILLEL